MGKHKFSEYGRNKKLTDGANRLTVLTCGFSTSGKVQGNKNKC
jgi:hypothetical protein